MALSYSKAHKTMEEEKIENLDSPNEDNKEVNDDEVVEEPEPGLPADPVEVEPKDDAEDDAEILKKKNQELYEQLKKAKGLIRDKTGKWVKKEKPIVKTPVEEKPEMAGITTEELYSLVKADVPDEDTIAVKRFARSNGMTITEALKNNECKAILKIRAEYRKTADAANTGPAKSGKLKVSDDTLESNASKGILPQDDAGIERLAKLKAGKKAEQ